MPRNVEKLWVESPEGVREQHTSQNARDLMNNAQWTLIGADNKPVVVAAVEPEAGLADDDNPLALADKLAAGHNQTQDLLNANKAAAVPEGVATPPATVAEDDEDDEANDQPDANVQPVVRDANGNLIDATLVPIFQAIEKITDKVDLIEYAQKAFPGTKLDGRKTEAKLRAEILELAAAKIGN